MPSPRELRLRVRSIKNLAQVTRALETVSASYVRRAIQATLATRPYAEKAWKVLVHLARQPGHSTLHPLLAERNEIRKVLVVMVCGDRGLAGAYNVNILRQTMSHFSHFEIPVSYVAVGRKGRDLLIRRNKDVIADFSHLPNPTSFMDVSAIGKLVVDDFEKGEYDQVWIAYTEYVSMVNQRPVIRKLLPLDVEFTSDSNSSFNTTHHKTNSVFIYEPDQEELLNEIVPRFTALQIYQSILSAQASEHTARMIAMRNATESANDLIGALQLEYNKLRQQLITNEMLDITGGAEALAKD
ncbi:MAG: ATP synthase F1 subunit gamma [Anaerolineaceae bacterium]|nr:ATP synthase F1 subunit gamma [Anaerolineaceae bacterium]